MCMCDPWIGSVHCRMYVYVYVYVYVPWIGSEHYRVCVIHG